MAGLCTTHCSYNRSKELPLSCQYFMKSVPTAKWGDLVLHSASADPDFYSACTGHFVHNVHIC